MICRFLPHDGSTISFCVTIFVHTVFWGVNRAPCVSTHGRTRMCERNLTKLLYKVFQLAEMCQIMQISAKVYNRHQICGKIKSLTVWTMYCWYHIQFSWIRIKTITFSNACYPINATEVMQEGSLHAYQLRSIDCNNN